jgi:serine/threonine protein kinase
MTSGDFTLIDFGIAHDAAATKVTKTGAIIGTLAYMAPERFTTGVADARADVYSLTCMLHECLTGTQPYPGDSAKQQARTQRGRPGRFPVLRPAPEATT